MASNADWQLLTPPIPSQRTIKRDDLSRQEKEKIVRCLRHVPVLLTKFAELRPLYAMESSLLDTLLYQSHNRFKAHKTYQAGRMIQKCLKRAASLDVEKIIRELRDSFPLASILLNSAKESLYLPSIEVVTFAIRRFQAAFALHEKIAGYCAHASDQHRRALRVGHFWNVWVVHIACISRVFSLVKTTLFLLNYTYESLLPLTAALQTEGEKEELPPKLLRLVSDPKLQEVLNKMHIDGLERNNSKEEENVQSTLKTICDNQGVVISRNTLKSSEKKRKSYLSDNDSDKLYPSQPEKKPKKSSTQTGDNAARESNMTPDEAGSETKHTQKTHISKKLLNELNLKLDYAKTSKQLLTFVQQESQLRKTSMKQAVTRKLTKSQWKKIALSVSERCGKNLKTNQVKELTASVKAMILSKMNI